jgi:hypothetical protein
MKGRYIKGLEMRNTGKYLCSITSVMLFNSQEQVERKTYPIKIIDGSASSEIDNEFGGTK